jgi:hypothetical protein
MALGGARPGAGRKKKTTTELQYNRREVVLASISAADLRTIVRLDVDAALAGRTDRIDRWLPYVLGSPKQEHEHSGAGGGPLVFTIAIDRKDGDDGSSSR